MIIIRIKQTQIKHLAQCLAHNKYSIKPTNNNATVTKKLPTSYGAM